MCMDAHRESWPQGCDVYEAKDVIYSTLGALVTILGEKCGLEFSLDFSPLHHCTANDKNAAQLLT